MQFVKPPFKGENKGHYTAGVISKGMLYVSGQLSIDPDTREVCQGDFAFVHTSNALSTQGHRRAMRPGHPSDGNAKTAADHEACQGGLGPVRASSAHPRRNANRRAMRPGRPSDGNAKTAADREA